MDIKKLFVDGDVIRYQVGSIMQPHPFLKEKGVKIPASEEMIKHHTDLIINRCIEVTDPEEFEVVLTDGYNFRNIIAKQEPYKGNRTDSVKPFHWTTVDQYLKTKYINNIFITNGYEADDRIAFQREDRVETYNYCIASRDKDLDTVPSWRYRWACGESQPEVLPYRVSEWQAYYFFFKQMLYGDVSTDNIMGCGIREDTYHGSATVLFKAGVKPEPKMVKGELKDPTITATKKYIKSLLDEALKDPSLATDLGYRYGIEKVLRRVGVGEKEADKLLSEANTIQDLYDIVSEQYEKRFEEDNWEDIMLENARLLYMGQMQSKLFNWSWLAPFLDVEKDVTDDKG